MSTASRMRWNPEPSALIVADPLRAAEETDGERHAPIARAEVIGAVGYRCGWVPDACASLAAGDAVGATLGLGLAAEQLASTAATTAAIGPARLAVWFWLPYDHHAHARVLPGTARAADAGESASSAAVSRAGLLPSASMIQRSEVSRFASVHLLNRIRPSLVQPPPHDTPSLVS
jgi:hypothetical protein